MTDHPEPRARPENSTLQYLREHGAGTPDELPVKPTSSTLRDQLAIIKVQGREYGGSASPDRPPLTNVRPIYYLYGDERRAVRKFIAENTALVEWAMDTNHNIIVNSVDQVIWQMMCEEWTWGDWD